MSANSDVCPICQRDGENSDVQWLACGHWMHKECFEECCDMKQIKNVEDFACLVCNKTETMIQDAASRLIQDTEVDVPSSGDSEEDIEETLEKGDPGFGTIEEMESSSGEFQINYDGDTPPNSGNGSTGVSVMELAVQKESEVSAI